MGLPQNNRFVSCGETSGNANVGDELVCVNTRRIGPERWSILLVGEIAVCSLVSPWRIVLTLENDSAWIDLLLDATRLISWVLETGGSRNPWILVSLTL